MGQNSSTRGPQVLVHVGLYQGSVLGTYFRPTSIAGCQSEAPLGEGVKGPWLWDPAVLTDVSFWCPFKPTPKRVTPTEACVDVQMMASPWQGFMKPSPCGIWNLRGQLRFPSERSFPVGVNPMKLSGSWEASIGSLDLDLPRTTNNQSFLFYLFFSLFSFPFAHQTHGLGHQMKRASHF